MLPVSNERTAVQRSVADGGPSIAANRQTRHGSAAALLCDEGRVRSTRLVVIHRFAVMYVSHKCMRAVTNADSINSSAMHDDREYGNVLPEEPCYQWCPPGKQQDVNVSVDWW